MKFYHLLLAAALLALCSAAVLAAGPVASPYESPQLTVKENLPAAGMDKTFGDPADFKAAALAGADYLRYMQADITDDNAGNGLVDTDPDDGGWDWSTTAFSHSAAASPPNIYGATVNGVFQVYRFEQDPALFTTMKDAADYMVAAGPASIRSAADIVFLLNFASLPEVTNPTYYTDGARAMWQYRLDNYGGTATSFAEGLRDYRGTGGWPNGIIPWDLAPYVEALMVMEGLFPGNDYGSDAAEIVEVIYADSFLGLPGYFEPHGHSKGFDPTWANSDYWVYSGGVAGIIRAFETAGMYTVEIPALETLLHECRYDDGAFSEQYGAQTSFDDRSWQDTAYVVWCLHDNLAPTAANLDAIRTGGLWLAATQDASGGWVYDGGTHLPEIGGECTAAVAYAWLAAGASVTAAVDGPDPAACGLTKTATFSYDRGDATPGLFGYEIVLEIAGPIGFTIGDFSDLYGMDYFQVVDQGGGLYSVNGTLYGAVPGILVDTDLFELEMLTTGDGAVTIDVVSYRLREPDNTPFFADMTGASFVVDCTAPAAVTDITAAPHHNRIEVGWTHDGVGVDHYVVFSGVWHDGAGVSVYPEYDDVVGNTIPTRPADYAAAAASSEWNPLPAAAVTNLDQIWSDATDRGVYYYEVFAVDAAGNISPAAAANDRATNYWLGDMDEDGFVAVVDDINQLGACFGQADGQVDYNEYCDVGRTDDWSRVGIPLTDSVINFEDLMVFSMNFSVVSDVNKSNPAVAGTPRLKWVAVDDAHYALRLIDAVGLKGVHVRADLPAGTVTAVRSGDLLNDQQDPTFLRNLGKGLDVNLAVLGTGAGFSGTGDLFVVETTQPILASELDIDARGADNARLEANLNDGAGAPLPRAFALHPNYPNPFNPMTQISFSLPEAQAVKLTIYGVDGRKVATLIDEIREAGTHEVIWSGRDDANRTMASGAYFCRIDAGPYSQVRKMTLMK